MYSQWLQTCLKSQQSSIQRHTLPNNELVWIRRADSHNSIWLYRLLAIFTKLLKTPALKPVPSVGGKSAIANEANALQRLAKAAIRVSEVLAMTDNALMTRHFTDSQTLEHVLHNCQNSTDLLQKWQLGVEAIADLHNKDQYVSQCFARNMLVCNDGKIAFIDFEDAPEQVLTLAECQTRDWLCYLHSTCLLLDDDQLRQQAIDILRNSLTDMAIENIYHNTRCLLWSRHLYDRRWRSDTLRVASVMRFVWALQDNQ